MIRRTSHHTNPRSAYRGAFGPGLGLLLAAPVAFVLLSVTAAALAGGSALALFLPAFLRHRSPRPRPDDDCIVLGPDQYSRVGDDHPGLPRS